MNLKQHLTHPVFAAVSKAAEAGNIAAYAIGGYVRDIILERPCKDIDFVTDADGIELANKTAEILGIPHVHVFKNFGTAMFKMQDYDIEFVGARKESYQSTSRKPQVSKGSIEDDQNRRDFTINALAIDLNPKNFGQLIDPFNGLQDLENKILRTPLNPDITYSDDPLRMMRAIRFATQLDFSIEPMSLQAIADNKHRLQIVSMERVSAELNKIIMAKKPSIGFKLLMQTGLLDTFFPEMIALKGVEEKNGVRHKDNFFHTLQVLDNVALESDDLWLRWSAILHDIAKPATKRYFPDQGWTFHGHEDKGARMVPKIFQRLKLPLDHKMKFVQKLVLLHLRPIALTKEEITDSAIRRLLFEAGDDIDELMTLCKADITSKNETKVKRYLENYEKVKIKLREVEESDHVRNFQPPVTGELIMEIYGIGPSKEVGIIKNQIKEAILEGEISNDYDEAFAFMQRKAAELGLHPKKH
jgi:poly(A) polymerase